jgi:glycosyltransferase involved in cell wall biosynthesis
MKKTIDICMFSYYFPPQYSGAALQAISLARKLRERGLDISFLTINHNGLPGEETLDGFKVFRLHEGEGNHGEFTLWRNMWKFFKKYRPSYDIIHSHGANYRNSIIGPLSRLLKIKSIVKISLANDDLYGLGSGRSGLLHKYFISMVDRYISISTNITREMLGLSLSESKIRQIPNGVDVDRFYPASRDEKRNLRKEFGLPLDGLMLLYIGVIDERKNVRWLIDMWNKFHNEYPGFLVVVGPVSREDSDKRLYNSLKEYQKRINKKLFFFEHTDQIEAFYSMADIFILPSINEGMPNVVLEAMASGLPCLVSRVSGAEDFLDNKNGFIFNVHKPETFLNGLKVLQDDSARAETGKIARSTVVESHSIEKISDQYAALYEELMKPVTES